MRSLSAAELRDLSRTFRELAAKHIHGDAPSKSELFTSRDFVQATAAAYRLADAPVEVLAGLAHGLKRCADHRTSAGRGDTR
jgi:hypothetical protein